jgi:hypothetical protein
MVRLVPGYIDPPETGPGFRKDKQYPVDPYSLWLDRRPEGFSVPPMENPQESVPHNNWIFPPEDNPARDYKSGVQGVAAQEQWYPGNDIFGGEASAPLPRPRPQQPHYYGPGINPFPGPPAPSRGIPYGTPAVRPEFRAPPPGRSIPPRRAIPPSGPLGPPGGFPRTLQPSSIPQGELPSAPAQPSQELMDMLRLLGGSFGGPQGGGGF